MKLNIFKLSHRFQADLDMDSLLKVTAIKQGLSFYSQLGFFGNYKFYGKYDKNDNLLLKYNYITGTKPTVYISKTDNGKCDIEIKNDSLTNMSIIFMLIIIIASLIISIYIQSIETALFVIAFLIIWVLLFNLGFKITKNRILQELDEFIIGKENG